MEWSGIDVLAAQLPVGGGYRFEMLRRSDVDPLIRALGAWYPDIGVGAGSRFLQRGYFHEEVVFADRLDRDVVVLVMWRGEELAGMFSCERDRATLALYAGLGVTAPQHRGARLVQCGLAFAEAAGRRMGMGLAYGMATLKTPYVQRAFEHAGWRLIGITPGYDREMVAPGVVKRVFEAVYAKVLVAESHLLDPWPQNMTPLTRSFFELLYPQRAAPFVEVAC